MRLRYSKNSSFVRKMLVAAHELGIADRITNVPTDPWSAETDLGHSNPLVTMPAIELDEALPHGSGWLCGKRMGELGLNYGLMAPNPP